MSHWLLNTMAEKRARVLHEADRVQFLRELESFLAKYDPA